MKNVVVQWFPARAYWAAVCGREEFPYRTKPPAIHQARSLARVYKAKLVIKNKDGSISRRQA